MKTTSLLTAVLATLITTGCTTSFRPWLLSEIHEDMNRAQVASILGEPDSEVSTKGTNYLYYSYVENPPPVSFSSQINVDFSRHAEQFNRSIREYTYEVRLVDGKVLGYRELEQR